MILIKLITIFSAYSRNSSTVSNSLRISFIFLIVCSDDCIFKLILNQSKIDLLYTFKKNYKKKHGSHVSYIYMHVPFPLKKVDFMRDF
jgi:ABC-type uncharacterized transport system permease subunit